LEVAYMDNLRCKARLSVLWVLLVVGTPMWLASSFMLPGVIEDIIGGQFFREQINDGFMLAFIIPFWLIPAIMAVLCFSLKDSANRWLNFIIAIILGVFFILSSIEPLVEGDPFVAFGVFDIAGPVVAALIAWFAWRLPKQKV
jgi:hypothetical protein